MYGSYQTKWIGIKTCKKQTLEMYIEAINRDENAAKNTLLTKN